MITAIELLHPQSANLLIDEAFESQHVRRIRISCGTTSNADAEYSEASDFFPSYASLNSSLFETSVIMTVWEHADELIGDDNVAIIHSDIEPHFHPIYTWKTIDQAIDGHNAVSLAVHASQRGGWCDWLVPEHANLTPAYDPYNIHCFDNRIFIWDIIREYDPDIHQWAMDTQPRMIYSHQFACSRTTFDQLGNRLHAIIDKMRISDIGFWTPHVFERLVALYLARIASDHGGKPILTTAFLHHYSSGGGGPGAHTLYGVRPIRFYHTCTRANTISNRASSL